MPHDLGAPDGNGPRRDYAAAQASRPYTGPDTGRTFATQPSGLNRQMDGSPIGAALAALEDASRVLHATISRHGERLEHVLHNVPPSNDVSEKMREPISVLERIAAAESLVRVAVGRLEGLTERLLL